jgi:hypothetical protein
MAKHISHYDVVYKKNENCLYWQIWEDEDFPPKILIQGKKMILEFTNLRSSIFGYEVQSYVLERVEGGAATRTITSTIAAIRLIVSRVKRP